jgi:hypothetical protein
VLCPERRQEIMEMMIQVHLNKTTPDFVKAHETLEAWLNQPSLSTEAKRYVELLKAEVFFREERLDDSKAIVSTIPKQSPHYHAAQLLNGRILLNIGNKILDDEGTSDWDEHSTRRSA